MNTGFSFGTSATGTGTGGLGGFGTSGLGGSTGGGFGGFGGTPAKTSNVSFGQTPAAGGLTLGQPASTASTGFNLGQANTSTGGFGLGSTSTTTTGSGFSLGGTSNTGSLTLGGAPASTGFGVKPLGGGGLLGGTTTTTSSTGFGVGGLGTKTTAGLALGSSAPSFSLGSSAATTTTSSGFSFGGLGGSGVQPSTVVKGLGGTDISTTGAASGALGANGKSGESKVVKESVMPNEITQTVEEFKKMVKDQKNVREDIARMSSKPLFRVQDETKSLRQMLSLVTNALQRNAMAINKLKMESAQELKHAEIAQRTKDTPPGLQYENTAPTEYFGSLVEDFESRMMLYRQQIEEMESHLASASAPATLTPQELSILLSRLQGSFVALAAQLQIIHESVKTQKEHFLNYRKVFHGETTDIFEKRRKIQSRTRDEGKAVISNGVGPTPFTGMSNAAAIAMASALNKTQQPAPGNAPLGGGTGTSFTGGGNTGLGSGTGLGLGNTSLGLNTGTCFGGGLNTGLGTGLGAATTTQSSGLFGGTQGFGGSSIGGLLNTTAGGGNVSFGSTSNTATVRPLGSVSMFGNNSAQNTISPAPSGAFQLQKPPTGNKRGKKA